MIGLIALTNIIDVLSFREETLDWFAQLGTILEGFFDLVAGGAWNIRLFNLACSKFR